MKGEKNFTTRQGQVGVYKQGSSLRDLSESAENTNNFALWW